MKITRSDGGELKKRTGGDWTFIDVTPAEAVKIIRSLSTQLDEGRANGTGRLETRMDNGDWLTIMVVPGA